MARLRSLLLVPLLVTLAAGCSAYVGDYYYMPRPLLAEVPASQPQQGPPLTVLASVIGVRRADAKQGIPLSVEVRLRLDNNGPETVVFDPRTMDLTNGALLKFPPPLAQPPQAFSLAPMQSATVRAYFPFPAGHTYDDTDLETLQLRWRVNLGGYEVGQVLNFRRVFPAYYDPYWDYRPYPGYGGVVIIHRR